MQPSELVIDKILPTLLEKTLITRLWTSLFHKNNGFLINIVNFNYSKFKSKLNKTNDQIINYDTS